MNENELQQAMHAFIYLIQGNKLNNIKTSLETYTPEEQREIIKKDVYPRGTLFNMAVLKDHIGIVKFFIEKGADVNHIYRIEAINETDSNSLLDAILNENLEMVKLLVENGATLTAPPNVDGSILHHTANIDILKYLLTKGAEVDALNHERNTPLMHYIEYNDEDDIDNEVLKALLDAGANPNAVNAYDATALDILVLRVNSVSNIPYIKLLRDRGAQITSLIQDAIKDGQVADEVLKVLNFEKDTWKGWTQSDAKALDTVFEEPANYSACPVCLKYSLRQDGCMYMNHKCQDLGGLYNRKLYDMYKNNEGTIYWCTLCNRICLGHRHYRLSSYDTKAELGEGGEPFSEDCRPYGGGLPEKVQRFNRLREHALELNVNSKISAKKAFNELTEEFWNAPLRREKRKIEGIIEKKKFGNATNFPENRKNNASKNVINAPDVPVPAGLVMPTLKKGYNSISMNDDVDVLQFHHETTGGIDHKDSLIGVKTLNDQLVERVKSYKGDNFGYCIAYPECKARLYPEEIKPYVSDELYKEYKKKFNIRIRNTSGGTRNIGGQSFFGEATNAKCLLIKKGGRKTRKRKSRSKKTRKQKRSKN
jgi:hypothetical protein